MKREEREEVRKHILKVIKQSQTYERLTHKEREKVLSCLEWCKLYGNTKAQIADELNQIYVSFLVALDYDPIKWREPNPEEVAHF